MFWRLFFPPHSLCLEFNIASWACVGIFSLLSGETRDLRTKLLIGNIWKSSGVNENLTWIPNATYHIPRSKLSAKINARFTLHTQWITWEGRQGYVWNKQNQTCMIFKRFPKLINILKRVGMYVSQSPREPVKDWLNGTCCLAADSLAAVFHIKYEHSYPREQSGSAFNHWAAVVTVGTPHSQVLLCMNTFLSQILSRGNVTMMTFLAQQHWGLSFDENLTHFHRQPSFAHTPCAAAGNWTSLDAPE